MRRVHLLGLGTTSLVLGFIGLMLFFLPVLGIPITIFGIAFGAIGLTVAACTNAATLRNSLGGLGLCFLALGVNFAIASAPEGYLPKPNVPKPWQTVPHRSFVAPPA